MALPIHNKIYTILALITILCSSNKADQKPNVVVTPDLIGKVCPKALNATVCIQFLKLGIGNSVAAMELEIILASQVCVATTTEAFGEIKDHVLNKRYAPCLKNLLIASSIHLVEAEEILLAEKGDYKNLPSKVSAAINEIETCYRLFDRSPSMNLINSGIRGFQEACSIAFLLSKYLAGRH